MVAPVWVWIRDGDLMMSVVTEVLVLPDETMPGPLRMILGSFRLEVTFLREGVWDIAERVGSTRVHHGRLVLQGGQFVVMTAGGVQASALRWQQALRQHLSIR